MREALRKAVEKLPFLPSPNAVTVLSFIIALLSLAEFFTIGKFFAWGFGLAFLLDAMDGAIARATGKVSKEGAFLDGVLDRLVEGAALLAVGFLGYWVEAFLLFMLGSCLTSFLKAYGEVKVGRKVWRTLLGREVRVALLFAFLLLQQQWLLWLAIALAALTDVWLFVQALRGRA